MSEEPRRIVAVGPGYGGVGATFDRHVQGMIERGNAVLTHRFPFGLSGLVPATRAYVKLRRALARADAVYVEIGRPDIATFWFMMIALWQGEQVVLMMHDPPQFANVPAQGILGQRNRITRGVGRRVLSPLLDRWLLDWVLARVKVILVLSESARDELAPYTQALVLAAPHGEFSIEPPGVNPADASYVLMAGFLGPSKGVDSLVEAWSLIVSGSLLGFGSELDSGSLGGSARSRLVIMGGIDAGPYADQLHAAGRTCKSPPIWLGSVTDDDSFDAVIANAAVVVLPYRRSSPASGILVRAMGAGRCVVATRLGAAAEVIEDGVDGLLVEPDSPRELAAAISRALADGELRERLGSAAASKADRLFSWMRSADVVGQALSAAVTDS